MTYLWIHLAIGTIYLFVILIEHFTRSDQIGFGELMLAAFVAIILWPIFFISGMAKLVASRFV